MASEFKIKRIIKDLKQTEIERITGIKQVRYSAIERELTRATPEELKKLAKVLD